MKREVSNLVKPIEFKRMFFVDDWATEMKSGNGARLKFKSHLIQDEKVLFYPDGEDIPVMVYPGRVFDTLESAHNELERQKKDYIKYLKEQRDKSIEKLKALEK
jgi:hypothetical protein